MAQKITIKKVDMPRSDRLEDEVRWLCNSLGFRKGRDTEDTCFKVMYEILELFSSKPLISSEDIAKELNIDSHTINHHIRFLLDTGIIFREKRKVALRGGSLSAAISEMRRDFDEIFDRVLDVSKRIDEKFRL